MNFTFEQMVKVVPALSDKMTIGVKNKNDTEIITITRGKTEVDFLRGKDEQLDLIMTIKVENAEEPKNALSCNLDNSGTAPPLTVGMSVAQMFVNYPHHSDTLENQQALLMDIANLFKQITIKQYH